MSDCCDRCGQPAIEVDGRWVHAEAADAAFCALVMHAGDPPPACRHCELPIRQCPVPAECDAKGWVHEDKWSHYCKGGKTVAEPEDEP